MNEIFDMVKTRLGREFEVVSLQGGKSFIVVYFNAMAGPAPQGGTEVEALEKFIVWFDENVAGQEVPASLRESKNSDIKK